MTNVKTLSHGRLLYEAFKGVAPFLADICDGYKWRPEYPNQILIRSKSEKQFIFAFSYYNALTWKLETVTHLERSLRERNG